MPIYRRLPMRGVHQPVAQALRRSDAGAPAAGHRLRQARRQPGHDRRDPARWPVSSGGFATESVFLARATLRHASRSRLPGSRSRHAGRSRNRVVPSTVTAGLTTRDMATRQDQFAGQLNLGALGRRRNSGNASGLPWARWLVYRLGTYIPIPGVDPSILGDIFQQQAGGILSMFNMFAGGAPGTHDDLRAQTSCPISPPRSSCS